MLNLVARQRACEDTIARTASIAASSPNSQAVLSSTFVPSLLPPLTPSHPLYPSLSCSHVRIHNSDAFALARTLPPSPGKTGVLNLASETRRAGGWRHTLSTTQEEALCYSSTLYDTLKEEWYPFPSNSCAAIFSPDVVVFKDTLAKNLVDLPIESRHSVAVITIAAPRWPAVTKDGKDFAKESDLQEMQQKILLTLRLAATNGVTKLVLGAMGCGAFGCPSRAVAREMKAALESAEFEGWFENVVFAVYAAGPAGEKNLRVFREVFEAA
ncbi:hypothetical protein B0A48_01012 [Cryoendolithus antarcticus]|uniref:Microbial-type PARG catalytic domain-containing protein n=1 Tax=Cryoendolithus antarcticus TaxID=1507870 RepID=A0A1V8TS08_9PEZI|nr:hypothetical protein B0A48_01012 [Cryoendolithus antarcticus]